jgi:hypothetical protein
LRRNQTNAKLPAKKKRKTAIPAVSEALDVDGIPVDVDVQSIMELTPDGKTADVDEFYGAPFDHMGTNGKVKKHRKCKVCL